MSSEFYYMENGKKEDAWLHAEILDNPTANREIQRMDIERAMQIHGLSLESIEYLYGKLPERE